MFGRSLIFLVGFWLLVSSRGSSDAGEPRLKSVRDRQQGIKDLNRLIADGEFERALRIVDALPESAHTEELVELRAACLARVSRDKEAIEAFSRLLQKDPKCPRYWAGRAISQFKFGDVDNAVIGFRQAMIVGDSAEMVRFRKSNEKGMDPVFGELGEKQLRLIEETHPVIRVFLSNQSQLRKWLVRQLSGEHLGEWIEWDDSPPKSSVASHQLPVAGRRAKVKVSGTRATSNGEVERSGEEIAASLTFELWNLVNAPEALRIRELAIEGRVHRRDFVRKSVELELNAISATRATFLNLVLPEGVANHQPLNPEIWYWTAWMSVEQIEGQEESDPSKYPWTPFGATFDWLRIEGLMARGEFDDAIGIARQLCRSTRRTDERLRAWRTLVDGCIRAERVAEAMEGVNSGLSEFPSSSELLVQRAYLSFTSRADFKSARQDLERVLRQDPKHEYAAKLLKSVRSRLHE